MSVERQPVRIFIAYSHKDRAFLDELRVHAAPLTRSQRLQIWFDGEIRPGEVWDASIRENLHGAHIILLLLSAHALHSDYFYEQEVREALKRHADGLARVVPVLLAPCMWDETPLAQLQGLPDGMKAITTWPDRDVAWENVLRGIQRIIGESEDNAPAPAKANPADEALWKIARQNNTRSAYQGYLNKMPLGLHAAEARDITDRIDADEALWEYANDPDTQDTFENNLEAYLEAFPNGFHTAEAQDKLDEFARQRAETERRQQTEAAVHKKRELESADPFASLLVHIPGGAFDMGDAFSAVVGVLANNLM
ncbi:MAG: TIR domain-containing protein [Saprospirales bacterium]|nr:TIR domain-containing protein [Saprospirales bacterium]